MTIYVLFLLVIKNNRMKKVPIQSRQKVIINFMSWNDFFRLEIKIGKILMMVTWLEQGSIVLTIHLFELSSAWKINPHMYYFEISDPIRNHLTSNKIKIKVKTFTNQYVGPSCYRKKAVLKKSKNRLEIAYYWLIWFIKSTIVSIKFSAEWLDRTSFLKSTINNCALAKFLSKIAALHKLKKYLNSQIKASKK